MLGGGHFLGGTVATTSTSAPGVYGPREVARKSLNLVTGNPFDIWPTDVDPYFSSVQVLCHFDLIHYGVSHPGPTYQNVGIGEDFLLLQGSNAGTQQVTGYTPHIYKWRGFSHGVVGVVNGGVRSLTVAAPGTGDFSIEMWVYVTSTAGAQTLWDYSATDGNVLVPYAEIPASGVIKVYSNVFLPTLIITGTTTVSLNTWHYIVVARDTGSTRLYLDGAQEGATYTDGNNYLCQVLWLGQLANGLGSQPLRGYIGEFRYTTHSRGYNGTTIAVPTTTSPDY